MRKIWRNEEGVSPVIAVILMVAITVVLAAVLYVMVSGMMTGSTTAPTGAFDFTETSTGNYTGGVISLSDDVKLSDCSWTIIDTSTGASASQGPPILSGTAVQAGTGLKLTFTDTNANSKVDAGDVINLVNADKNDQIKLIHDTGKSIAAYTIP
jgi:flagellin-like protein